MPGVFSFVIAQRTPDEYTKLIVDHWLHNRDAATRAPSGILS